MNSKLRASLISVTLVCLGCFGVGALAVFEAWPTNRHLPTTSQTAIAIVRSGVTAPSRVQRVFPTNAPNRPRVVENYGKIPVIFEANQGQADSRVKFLSRGLGYTLFLTGNEAVLSLRKADAGCGKTALASFIKLGVLPSQESLRAQGEPCRVGTPANHEAPSSGVLRMKLLGVSPAAKSSGLDELPGKSNYFIGNEPKKWRTNVPVYAKVKYEGVYPGVDLIFYGNQHRLEYDFVVAPGVDPLSITFRLEGSQKLTLDPKGNLVIAVDGGEVHFEKPVIYQESGGFRREIVGGYVLKNARRVNFQVGPYDHSRSLIIDPPLVYSTYLGGSGFDFGGGIAVDSAGNAYVTGLTGSANFPTTAGAFKTTFGGGSEHAFVTKLNPQGNAVVYSTYLGGSGSDEGRGIAVDPSGNAYVTGLTESVDFPTTPGAFQTTSTSQAAFVTKLNSQGNALLYSSYLGGNTGGFFGTFGNAIALDSAGDAYVTGGTTSTNFPTTPGAFQTAIPGFRNAFVTKMNPAGSALVYSTYLGGAAPDLGSGVAVDSVGNAYVTGGTDSTNFPTTPGAFQTTFGGRRDAFVTELNSTGSALVYSTYLGGANDDGGGGIAVDSAGNAYVTGFTESPNFPTTAGAFQRIRPNAFITKLNPPGTALAYSTYLGGGGRDWGGGIALDSAGDAYVTGFTASTDFPTTPGAFQTTFGGGFCGDPPTLPCSDAFATKLSLTGAALIYSTYLGGSDQDGGRGIAVDSAGDAYVTGQTTSTNFPTTPGAFQTTFGGGSANAFVTKISPSPAISPPPDFSLSASPSTATVTAGQSASYTVSVSPSGGFAGTVAFLCAGAPKAANCSISPVSADITGPNAVTAALTVTTTARAGLPPAPRSPATPWIHLATLWVVAMLLVLLWLRRCKQIAARSVRSFWAARSTFAALVLLFVMVSAAMSGCSSGGSTGGGGGRGGGGTPAGNYTLTVTATSGSSTHSTTFALVVN